MFLDRGHLRAGIVARSRGDLKARAGTSAAAETGVTNLYRAFCGLPYRSAVLIEALDTPELIRRLPTTAEAVGFAREKHEGQVRQVDGAPFILHPLEVAVLLYEDGARDELTAAGALHDVLEKTDATAYELSARLGRRIAEIVRAMTEDPAIGPYARRKAALREQVAAAGTDALTVFAADKLSNVREQRLCAGEVTPLRRRKVKHYRHCLALLQERLPEEPLVRDFARELEELIATTPALTPAS